MFETMDKQLELISKASDENISIEEALESYRPLLEVDINSSNYGGYLSEEDIKSRDKRKKELAERPLRIIKRGNTIKSLKDVTCREDMIRSKNGYYFSRCTYDIAPKDYDRLNLYNYMLELGEEVVDLGWLLRLVQCTVKVADEELEEDRSFRFGREGAVHTDVRISDGDRLNKVCKLLRIKKDRSDFDDEMLKFVKRVLGDQSRSKSSGNMFVVEEDLKRYLIDTQIDEHKKILDDIHDVLEYHLIPFQSKSEATNILVALDKLICCGFELGQVEGLVDENGELTTVDWIDTIYNYIEEDENQ